MKYIRLMLAFTVILTLGFLDAVAAIQAQLRFVTPCSDSGGFRRFGYVPDSAAPDRKHLGHDFRAAAGTPVVAIADGVVHYVNLEMAGFGSRGRQGPMFWIRHRLDDGRYFYALYGHAAPLKGLVEGKAVTRGQVVGTLIKYLDPDTNEDISHLHFGIWDSPVSPPLRQLGYGPVRDFTDPLAFLAERRPYQADADRHVTLGGIVYTDGRQVIYQDLRSGEKRDLVGDLAGSGQFAIKAATVSPDGRTLVFLDRANKLWGRVLPYGKVYPIELREEVTKTGRPHFVQHLLPRDIGNLTLSSHASRIAYESTKQAEGLKEVRGDSKEHLRRTTVKLPIPQGERKKLLAYIPTIDTFRAVTALGIRETGLHVLHRGGKGDIFHFGNPILYPRHFPYLDVETRDHRMPTKGTPTGYASFSKGTERKTGYISPYIRDAGYRCEIPVEEAQKCFGIKRNAHFPAWHPEKQWLAVIYQTNRWNLDVSLPDCEWLAWRPDGAISYLSEGKVLVIDADQMAKGIENSHMVWKQSLGRRFAIPIFPVDHWFKVTPQLVASGIRGARFYWVSNNTLVFQDENGALYLWSKEGTQRLLASIPEEFTYCPPTAFAVSSGTSRAQAGHVFDLGVIETSWEGAGIDETGWNSVYVRTALPGTPDEGAAECALVQDLLVDGMDDVKDPSAYDYMEPKGGRNPDGSFTIPSVRVNLNQIALLRNIKGYAAIRPLEIEGKWLTFEWKFWPRDEVERVRGASTGER